ncbi:hypothetical protein C8F04DRAFT_1102021 [Mycena alexandri]|uniref:Uncharacterized protein n=1 Tax=Mycena alexandri TaxID=1745969 RepID=A0AAD6X3R9_9AGAR|nr:hypothetical protein C8F04DRAFT_1102021 [Mycena alexandri]
MSAFTLPTNPPPPRLSHIVDIHIDLAPPVAGGVTPHGGPVNFFEIIGGRITSAAGSPHVGTLDATILPGGGDYTTVHPTAGVVTLDINMVARDTAGTLYRFQNSGFIHMTEKVGKVLMGAPDAVGTEFGEEGIFETIRCTTSSEEHGWLNFATVVAQGRLVVENAKLKGIQFRGFELLKE